MSKQTRRIARPTLMDVARHAGVSRATASLVVRKSPLVSRETRASVEAAMAEIGYVYNAGAAGMRAARSRTIGVIIPNLSNPFFGILLTGIDHVVEGAGLATFIAQSAESQEKQDGFVTRMREHGVDGLIVCPAAGTKADFTQKLQMWGMPVVEVLRTVGGEADYVGMDQFGGMYGAVSRLVELGHVRIGFVTANLDHSAREERLSAFRAAIARYDAVDAVEMTIEPTHGEATALALRMARQKGAPSAWICHNDVIGLGMHRGFCEAGLVPGRDVSLIGYDNVAETELVRPALASVATEAVEIGQLAASQLLRRIENPDAPRQRMTVPSHFVDRGSVGPRAFDPLEG
ncbi:LacI family DNA-binding transcriptional regulator [Pelagibacterium sp. H642]|uniref:LacI family DNA-binding transcriptional regulator n=1 Tax=Pelagibacterium sp. H642 TaxID=1881069 RepID=UPI002815E6A2|nr:LacI family DNA-binding transcriptional regulator [Pelagibacterium sp. H642]WMT91578.1 LacI family DNA-binding transcriptional regulator [Pelagibacterium sp. H642]